MMDSHLKYKQHAVSDRLPMAVLLETDVPQLPELLSGELLGSETRIENALVVTRAREPTGGGCTEAERIELWSATNHLGSDSREP